MNNLIKVVYEIGGLRKTQIYFYVTSSVVLAILDTVSIAAVIPMYHKYSEVHDKGSALAYGSIIVAIFFSAKCIATLGLIYYQNKCIYELQSKLTTRLFAGLMSKKYEYHVRTDQSKVLNLVLREIDLVTSCILNLSILTTEMIIILIITGLILYNQPETFLVISAASMVLYFIFKIFVEKKMKKLGKERNSLDQKMTQTISESLSAIKEVLIYGNSKYFISILQNIVSKIAVINKVQITISQSPRVLIEFIVVGMICTFVYVESKTEPPSEIIAILGFFLMASFRLMPSISRVLNAKSNIYYGFQSVDNLCNVYFDGFNNKDNLGKKYIKFEDHIQLKDLSYSINNKLILNEINFVIKKGDAIVICGESGSGKTTLVDLISGLLSPSTGSVEVDGLNIKGHEINWLNKVSYMPQFPYLLKGSIEDNIVFGDSNKRPGSVAQAVELIGFNNNEYITLQQNIGERALNISGGQKQRIAIARAIYKNADLLILDEITSGLDEKTGLEIIKKIREIFVNKTIICITHNPNHISLFDKGYEVNNRKLYQII